MKLHEGALLAGLALNSGCKEDRNPYDNSREIMVTASDCRDMEDALAEDKEWNLLIRQNTVLAECDRVLGEAYSESNPEKE